MNAFLSSPAEAPAQSRARSFPSFPAGASTLILWTTLLLALVARTTALSTYGFSEDEVAKLRAIEAYRNGDFSANAEHPMLMKLAMLGSLSMADAWNGVASPTLQLPPEAALRLPNAVAGTVTVAAMYGIALLFFGPSVAALTALIVALDPTVIALNRIGKEDTFLMLFFMLGVYAYERAKRVGESDVVKAQPWYNLSGVSFGLMLASKYLPHFFGLYAGCNLIMRRDPGANKPWKVPYNGLIVAAFLVFNFAILLPSTWMYVLSYLRTERVVHLGHLYNGHLYSNWGGALLAGIPASYYPHLLVTKLLLPVLIGVVVGVVPLVTRRRELGFVWIRILFVPVLLAYSMFAAKFQRYALPMILVIDMLGAVGLVMTVRWLAGRTWPKTLRTAAAIAFLALTVGAILLAPLRVVPFYSIYQNAIGAALAPPATVFPEEAYDFGVREAVQAIAAVAKPGAAIVSDASMSVEHYLERSGRADLTSRALSGEGLGPRGEQWVLVQDGHLTFENESIVAQLRRSLPRWREYRLGGTVVLEVFHVTR